MGSHKNILEIEGNLVKQPELKTVGEGYKVALLRLASDQYYKSNRATTDPWEKATTYFTVEVWGELAEKVCQLGKGVLLAVKGSLAEKRWEGPDGKHISMLFVHGDEVNEITRERSHEEGVER